MRRILVAVGVLLGILVGGLTLTGSASAATPAGTASMARGSVVVAAEVDGCKDPNNWWDNLRLNAGSMDYCDTDLDWPWEAGDATCTVISNGQAVPELVNCAGSTAATSGTTECWINVPTTTDGVAATSTTVCTSSTDQTHRDTLKAAVARDPNAVQGHCGFGDGTCAMFEGFSQALISDSVGTMVGIVGTGQFTTEGTLWDAASGEWSYWVWAILGVLFCATVWSITQAMYSRDRADMVTALTRTVVAWPMILITYWGGSQLISVFDNWTLYTLTRGDSLAGVFRRFSQIIYAGGEGHYFMTFLIALAIWVGTKLLIVVFALRTLGLAVLMMAGPVAWMMFPVKSIGPQWVVAYFSAGFTLLLAGPLTMGFITLILRGLGNLKVLWSPEAWPLLLGLILVVFAPFAVMSLFSFAGASAADRLGSAAGNAGRFGVNTARGAGRQASGLGRQAMQWAPVGRSNARPAGLPSGGRPSPAGRSDRRGPSGGGKASSSASSPSLSSKPQAPAGQTQAQAQPKPQTPSSTPSPAGRGGRS